MKLAVLIRAHQFSEQEVLLAERLEAAFQSRVYFVTDDSVASVSTGRFTKIGITRRRVRQLRGGRVKPKWGWQQGDVFYFAARAALGDVTHFAMIESDVYLGAKAAHGLASVFTTRPEDVLAVELCKVDEPKAAAKDLEGLGQDNCVSCFFPVNRISATVVDCMQELRRRAVEQPDLRLNDEAILASVALSGKFSHANLSEIAPELFDPSVFTLERTQLFEHFRDTYDGLSAIHPVRNVNALLQRIEEIGAYRNLKIRYQEALDQATPQQRQKLQRAMEAAAEGSA